ncbi:superoxide dismutase [Dyadobacter fermentans]|uniref:Superoxide dismutase n=1 Tax=Dyadobacter fermentans (strain ATCC 700827 / DSM 18053 / CIP 107007 / KCTC 52180 / NS114) TaxID=471854 RepID=C6W0V1_DYAFD|nr:superoxide dismutase [Dyadobacter fermentans]ACT95406.1 Superoxide dismutase [Dyadobacter fermentans DSM 18053]
MAFTLDPLPYANNALEPHFDALTMEIHHDRHHQAYVTNLNAAVAGTELEGKTIEELLAGISKAPAPVRNNGGGHWNHSFFWKSLSSNGGGEPTGELGKAITAKFGSFQAFKDEFKKAATGRFGSGWAWLIKSGDGVAITSTPNQDNPLMDIAEVKGTPIIGLDVWEHAYYLKYQNKRPDYIDAYWNVVDWKAADALYTAAK